MDTAAPGFNWPEILEMPFFVAAWKARMPRPPLECRAPKAKQKAPPVPENWVTRDRMGGVVKRLQVDANGHVWVLTCLYVEEYNPKNKTFRVFNISDSNIKADYFQDLKAKGKEVSFCGSGGIYTVFSSNALEQESEEAHAVVTEVHMDSTSIFLGYGKKHLVVPAKTEHLLLYLSSFDHLNADKVTFAYRMLGKGKEEWMYLPTGLNVLHLTNLSKGKFDLEVKVTNKQGQWSQGEVVLTIEKEPEWWETWWATMSSRRSCSPRSSLWHCAAWAI